MWLKIKRAPKNRTLKLSYSSADWPRFLRSKCGRSLFTKRGNLSSLFLDVYYSLRGDTLRSYNYEGIWSINFEFWEFFTCRKIFGFNQPFLLTGIFDRSSNIFFLALFPICFEIFTCKRKREYPDTFFMALTTKTFQQIKWVKNKHRFEF